MLDARVLGADQDKLIGDWLAGAGTAGGRGGAPPEALRTESRQLLGALRDGVRANAIMPGFIDTPMAVDAPAQALGVERADYAARRADHVPLGRQGTAWDVAHAALYLSSDEAQFVTGVVLAVDGGQSALVG